MPRPDANRFATDEARWHAVRTRDPAAGSAFVYAVTSTGIVCRPACPSRTPRRENVAFYTTVEQAERAGFRPCMRCHAGRQASPSARTLAQACALLDSAEESVRAADVAKAVGLTPASLVRTFRTRLGVTPGQYRRRVLARRVRDALGTATTVTEAIYAAGYSTSSRFYAQAGPELGMPPRSARRGGTGEAVEYAVRTTSLGTVGIAWTPRGLSDLFFVDTPAEVATAVLHRWPRATRSHAPLPAWIDAVIDSVERPVSPDIPLDIQGTAFQERVWRILRTIPLGETRTYAEIAAAIDAPKSHRAVARAIGQNRIAVLVPCHRVVGSDGTLRGYRWGMARKAELLRREAVATSHSGKIAPGSP